MNTKSLKACSEAAQLTRATQKLQSPKSTGQLTVGQYLSLPHAMLRKYEALAHTHIY